MLCAYVTRRTLAGQLVAGQKSPAGCKRKTLGGWGGWGDDIHTESVSSDLHTCSQGKKNSKQIPKTASCIAL